MVKLSRVAQLVSGRGRVACTRGGGAIASAARDPIHSGSNASPQSEREKDEVAVEVLAGEE